MNEEKKKSMVCIAPNFFSEEDYELEMEFLFFLMIVKIAPSSTPLFQCFWFHSLAPLFKRNVLLAL